MTWRPAIAADLTRWSAKARLNPSGERPGAATGLTAGPNHAHEVGVDLCAIEFAVAISIGLTHEPERRRATLSVGDCFRQSDNAVAVSVAFMKCSGLRGIVVNPFAFREPAIGVCIGSREDDIDQVLGRLLTRKFSVVVRVGESERVVRDRDRSGCSKCLVRLRTACQPPRGSRLILPPRSPVAIRKKRYSWISASP